MNAALPPAEPSAHAAHILSEADYALIGARAAQAGFGQQEISALLATVERVAFQSAQAAARQTAMAIVPQLMDTVRATHQNAAYRIVQALENQAFGWGGAMHRRCVQIAQQELNGLPHHRTIEAR